MLPSFSQQTFPYSCIPFPFSSAAATAFFPFMHEILPGFTFSLFVSVLPH
jgi:hypothetical protein